MNRNDQISTQNLQDCWSILYKNLAKSLLHTRGKDAEVVVRRANRLCGLRMGQLERERHLAKGKLANLETLFSSPVRCIDPRFRISWQLFNEQEAVYDVLTCPIYDYLLKTGDKSLMLPLCEEFESGLIAGYTGGAGQCNLSENFVYPGENSCRFACYYRPANLEAKDRACSFRAGRPDEAERPADSIPCEDPRGAYARLAGMLLDAYYEECVSRYGESSVCMLSEGLKEAARETARHMRYRSGCLFKSEPEKGFIEENCFWGVAPSEIEHLTPKSGKLVEINFCRTLWAELQIHGVERSN